MAWNHQLVLVLVPPKKKTPFAEDELTQNLRGSGKEVRIRRQLRSLDFREFVDANVGYQNGWSNKKLAKGTLLRTNIAPENGWLEY